MITQYFSGTPGALNGYSEGGATWNDPAHAFTIVGLSPAALLSNGPGGACAELSKPPASPNYSVDLILDAKTISGYEIGILGRWSDTGGYLAQWNAAIGCRLLKCVSGNWQVLGTNAGANPEVGFNRFSLKMVGTAIAVILNGIVVCSASDITFKDVIGTAGLRSGSAPNTSTTGVHIQQIAVNDAPNVSVSAGARTATTVTLVATAADASPPYSYQWHRSRTSAFVPGPDTIIAGANAATITDAPGGLGVWFYKCLVTDAAGAVGTSLQVPAACLRPPLVGWWMGDSVIAGAWGSGGKTVPQSVADIVSRALNRPVTIYNQAIGGTTTGDWLPGGLIYNAAIASLPPGAFVMCSLGNNDYRCGVAIETIAANLAAITADLVSRGHVVVLNTPMCVRDEPLPNYHDTQANIAIGQQIQGVIDDLANGTTILRGCDVIWEYTAVNLSEQLVEGLAPAMETAIHPTPTGEDSYAYQYAATIIKLFG